MLRKANGHVDGLIIETRTAGGHNAPPRGKLQLTPQGEPVYGDRDTVDIGKLRELGTPFWLAGGYGSPSKLREALDLGATGVQVGTAFAFTSESALREDLKQALLDKARRNEAQVFTDPLASPAGFPFKVAQLEVTASDPAVCAARPRICDLGFLSEVVRAEDGTFIHRCPAEPLSLYLSKGGKTEDAAGRKCLCNALMANIGLQQTRNGHRVEPPSSLPATTSPQSPASSPQAQPPTPPPTCSTPCSPASRYTQNQQPTNRFERPVDNLSPSAL